MPGTVVQYPTFDQSFWSQLPDVERSAAITSKLKEYVSFDEIVDACLRADGLIVMGDEDVTIVGIRSPETAMPKLDASMQEFVQANSGHWVAIPEDGSPIKYAEDQLCVTQIVSFPRLTQLEMGREEDTSGLLFSIVTALGLQRAYYDTEACVATYC